MLLAKLLTSEELLLIQRAGLDEEIESILEKIQTREMELQIASQKIQAHLDFCLKKDQIEENQENSEKTVKPGKFVIDLHLGGEDHIDVHHKNEIAQSKSLGIGLSRHWTHNKFVLVDGKKMSKSLGNVYLVDGKHSQTGFYSFENPPTQEFSPEFKQQIIKKYKELKLYDIFASNKLDLNSSSSEETFWENFSFDPLAYRLMCLEHHYNQQMDFTWEKLWQSQMRLWGLRKNMATANSYFNQFSKIEDTVETELNEEEKAEMAKFIHIRLETELTKNLDLPRFLEWFNQNLEGLVNLTLEKYKRNSSKKSWVYEMSVYFEESLLNLNLCPQIPENILILANKRQESKEAKDWTKADQIRTEIQKLGWQIDDYPWGFGLWWRGDYKIEERREDD